MNCARNCENLLNFVQVMPKILLVPFFRTRCIITSGFVEHHTYFRYNITSHDTNNKMRSVLDVLHVVLLTHDRRELGMFHGPSMGRVGSHNSPSCVGRVGSGPVQCQKY